jgi:hypothetical protein
MRAALAIAFPVVASAGSLELGLRLGFLPVGHTAQRESYSSERRIRPLADRLSVIARFAIKLASQIMLVFLRLFATVCPCGRHYIHDRFQG